MNFTTAKLANPGWQLLILAVFSLNTATAEARDPVRMMGEETIGNQPLNAMNYQEWPKIMPVANHKSRVYHTWVNGDEQFYYQCDAEQLNELLAEFGKTDQDKREIVILPGPATTTNFQGDRTFAYNCQLHLVGGIAKHIAGKDKGNVFWPIHPRITIRLDRDFDLNQLKVPQTCQLVAPSEMKKRYAEGLTSQDQSVRGWGNGFLAEIDPYDQDSLKTIAGMLNDKVDWVALNALTCIGRFGEKAAEYIPRLEEIAAGKNEQNAAAARKAIAIIKAAGEPPSPAAKEQEAGFRRQLIRIEEFIAIRNGV